MKGINSTDKVYTINTKTERFIEENGGRVLIELIEYERGKHNADDIQNDNFKNFSTLSEGSVIYNSKGKGKNYVLKRVGSKQIAFD